LRAEAGIAVVVQPSQTRIFPDSDFVAAGARVSEDLSSCDVVLGVKEMPEAVFQQGHAYVFFAHVIKGQPYNMPMLKRTLQLGCTLIDYERIADASGERLVAFGRFAGLAGMIDTLWAFGRRLSHEGIETPFAEIRQAMHYDGLEAAKEAVLEAGRSMRAKGLPELLCPLVCGFAGYGKVSQGAQEIFDLLPAVEIAPGELASRRIRAHASDHARHVYKVVFKEEHLVEPSARGNHFELQDYYEQPQKYRSRFAQFLQHLTLLMNCIYWDTRYPRLVTKSYLRSKWKLDEVPKLRVIGDVSCDVEGAIEATVKITSPSDPVFVYDPTMDRALDGVEGSGPVILSVDILPTELPLEASSSFGAVLSPFVPALVGADYSADFDDLDLPPELKRAVITHHGELTPAYRYIAEYLDSNGV
jgi:alpha-aminoadipic semialdehyde synthase